MNLRQHKSGLGKSLEKIIENQIEYSFISSNTDKPKTVEEALNSTEAE